MDRIQRTKQGYRFGNTEIEKRDFSPRESQVALLRCGQGLSAKDTAEIMGITPGTTQNTSNRMLWRLDAKNLIQATIELHKRGLIKHLCAALMIFASLSQSGSQEIHRRPPGRHGQKIHRGFRKNNRDPWADILNQLQPQ